VSFAAITLCVASQRVFIVVYFVIDSVRKLLDTPPYIFSGELLRYKCVTALFFSFVMRSTTRESCVCSQLHGLHHTAVMFYPLIYFNSHSILIIQKENYCSLVYETRIHTVK
jgi:hypothetical protein